MQTIKGKVTWIDVLKPNQHDSDSLKKIHQFHPLILDELLHASARARVEHYKTYLFIVYHIPVYDPKTKTSRRAEIDLLITKDTFILVRYEKLEHLEAFINEISQSEQLQKELLGGDSYQTLHRVMEKIIDFSLRQLRHIEEEVQYVGAEIFAGHENELLRSISYVKRNILDYRLIVRPHELILSSLRDIGVGFWGEKSRVYLADLMGDNLKVIQGLENYFQIIESLENTNGQLLSAATNATIQRFTVLAFLFTIPLFFIFLTDNEFGSSLISSPRMFWTLLVLVFALVSILAFVFKRKKML